MKVQIDIEDDDVLLKLLTRSGELNCESIHQIISTIRNLSPDEVTHNYLLEDLQNMFKTHDSINEVLDYHGGDRIDIITTYDTDVEDVIE